MDGATEACTDFCLYCTVHMEEGCSDNQKGVFEYPFENVPVTRGVVPVSIYTL